MVAPCSRGVFLAVCVSSYNLHFEGSSSSVDLALVFAKSQRSEYCVWLESGQRLLPSIAFLGREQ